MLLVISSSLRASSRSRILARFAHDRLRDLGQEIRFLDLLEQSMPFCDDENCYEDERVERAERIIVEARGILLATPIYNYDASAAAKNLIELTGEAWKNKVVGFLCAAGGRGSYMSITGLANSLMLDFHCLILPRFVFATDTCFADGQLSDVKVQQRVIDLCDALVRITAALESHGPEVAPG